MAWAASGTASGASSSSSRNKGVDSGCILKSAIVNAAITAHAGQRQLGGAALFDETGVADIDRETGVIRSKGWFWLANRMDWVGELNSVGAATRTQAAGFRLSR